ncbi:MAG TPA: dolichyl-phosphate beta-glucosyltransferase [bacterium]
MGESGPEISAVIPCFNEEAVLERTARALASVLERTFPRAWELILVDDGSLDATWEVAQRLAREPGIRATRHPANRGKGAAVRTGVLLTRGDPVLVCDADGSTPPAAIGDLLDALRRGADIAIGDRWGRGAALGTPQPPLRRFLGKGYALLSRRLTGVRVTDFNCGFKLFRGEVARALFAACRSERWTWDVEILAAAANRGLSIRAVPVSWSQGPRSTVHPVRDVLRSLRDLGGVWWRLRRPGAGPAGR